MRKPVRVLLLVVAALIAAASLYFLLEWNKPHRSAAKEKGIVIAVPQLIKAYTDNEHAADSLYGNKTLEITGRVSEWGANDGGQSTALFNSGDAMTDVFCTFKDSSINARTAGDSITLKGFCSGLIGTDIKLTDCVMKK